MKNIINLIKEHELYEIKDIARQSGDFEIEILLTNEPIRRKLIDLIKENDFEGFKTAIENGADVNAKTIHGWNYLHFASSLNRKEFAEFLIEKGIDIEAKDQDGWTPLYIAEQECYQEMIDLLTNKN